VYTLRPHTKPIPPPPVNRRSKEYFEVVFANARTLVEPALADKSVIAVADLKPTGSFVRGEVVELADDSATLADGRRLPFEFAVVAAGSGQAWGKGAAATAAERRAEIRAEHQALRAAPAMVVVGGGSLGVEIAGEVVTGAYGWEKGVVRDDD
jgi:NADH dehydrogenase FAD-containing subunit